MRIILGGADFSANNIGQVEVPINYKPETLAYLAAIPTTSATLLESENRAINSFFTGLINKNLLEKVERVYIPRFGNVDGNVNLVNPTQTPFNLPTAGGGVAYDSNGILLGENFFTANFTHGFDNKFVGFANKTGVATIPSSSFRSSVINYPNFVTFGRVVISGASGLAVSGSDRVTVTNRTQSTGYILTSTDTALAQRSVIVDGEYVVDARETNNTSTTFTVGGQDVDNHRDCSHHISLLLFGTKLNQTEMGDLGLLIDNLMAVV